MKLKNILTLIALTFTFQNSLKAQSLFFIGDKSYPSTGSFELKLNSSYDNLKCLIAKNGTAGFFVISKGTMTGSVIKGKAIIYLDDGSVLTLLDKGKRDYVDETSTNVYSLTAAEIIKLKNSNINTVRFTIKCPGTNCESSEDGNFTAKNEFEKSFSLSSEKKRINTMELIVELFK